MGALDQVYPVVPQKGCLFHLFKNIHKCLQDESMPQLLYEWWRIPHKHKDDKCISFRSYCRYDPKAFDVLSNHACNQQQVILDYFESNYMGEFEKDA